MKIVYDQASRQESKRFKMRYEFFQHQGLSVVNCMETEVASPLKEYSSMCQANDSWTESGYPNKIHFLWKNNINIAA